MKASDVLVKALQHEGVEYIFGLPGEENLDFLESLRKSEKIKLILTRHEQGAGFMAATYGRLTGKAGVCLSTLGPGATNLVTPAAYAQLGAMPMVMITGQKPIRKNTQGRFQIIDIVQMMQPLTKCTRQVTDGSQLTAVVREAFRLAQGERPGVVHIELPEDIAAEDVDHPGLFEVIDAKMPYAGESMLQQAAEMIKNAERPLLLIGAGANRKRASAALTNFVAALSMPFFTTQMGKGVIDERSPFYIGTAALSENDFLHEAIDGADLIINVGHDIVEKPPFLMDFKDRRKVIHLNFFPAGIDAVYFPQLNVIGDIAYSISELTKYLKPFAHLRNSDFFLKIREKASNHLAQYENDDRFPLLPQRVVRIVRDALAEDGIVTLDNGMYKIWFARDYPTYVQNSLLLDNALATMGAGLPSAMTAKMLNPDQKVVSINGDGGFMMNAQELETAIRLQLDLVVIILNDNAYGMIQWKQQEYGFEHYGLDYGNPDFVKFAESFGAKGYRPASAKAFKLILEEALNAKGVHLIDVATDYSLNHEALSR